MVKLTYRYLANAFAVKSQGARFTDRHDIIEYNAFDELYYDSYKTYALVLAMQISRCPIRLHRNSSSVAETGT